MKILFLFFTPSESGAPGYLSRKGEEAAVNLAESTFGFLVESLGLDLVSGAEERARSLEEDVRWRLFRKPGQLRDAVKQSLLLQPDVLLLCGGKERTLNTAQALASRMVLPACVDARADCSSDERQAPGSLRDTLRDVSGGALLPDGVEPRTILVGTSREALEEWMGEHFDADKFASFKNVMESSTQGGAFPAVFACGMETVPGASGEPSVRWLFD